MPIAQTKTPPIGANSSRPKCFSTIAEPTKTRTNVAMASLMKLDAGFRMAGIVQKTPRLATGSGVSAQCGR
jgi:hypothetical protein